MKARLGGAKAARNNPAGERNNARAGDEHEEMLPQLDDMLAPDEVEEIGDLGGDGDDAYDYGPEVAGAERLADTPYWRYQLWRFEQTVNCMKAVATGRMQIEETRVPQWVWRRLEDEALGLTQSESPAVGGPDANAPVSSIPRDMDADSFAEFKRGLGVLHKIAVLGARFDDEIGKAKRHMDEAQDANKEIARLAFKFGRERKA